MFIKRFWYARQKVRLPATIDKVNLCVMEPGLIVPEVNVRYKYYFKNGLYYGNGYAELRDLLNQEEYEISFNQAGEPILKVAGKLLITEEHIEAYLLELHETVDILIDPIEPFHSEIEGFLSESISLKL